MLNKYFNKLIKDKYYWFNRGEKLVLDGSDYDEAIRCYIKAISLDPLYVDSWNARGYVLHLLKRYEEALKCFNRAIEIDDNNLDGWSNKGLTLYKMEKYEEALLCYDRVVSLNPDYPNGKHNREKIVKFLEERETNL